MGQAFVVSSSVATWVPKSRNCIKRGKSEANLEEVRGGVSEVHLSLWGIPRFCTGVSRSALRGRVFGGRMVSYGISGLLEQPWGMTESSACAVAVLGHGCSSPFIHSWLWNWAVSLHILLAWGLSYMHRTSFSSHLRNRCCEKGRERTRKYSARKRQGHYCTEKAVQLYCVRAEPVNEAA
jgi:hypothetical protein